MSQPARTAVPSRTYDRSARAAGAALVVALAVLFALSAWTVELPSPSSSRLDRLRNHASYLASEQLTGRGIDTPGIELARDYIAVEFAKYGLRPAGANGSYLQKFEVLTGVAVKQPSGLTLDNQAQLALDQDWTPLGFSASGKVAADVVFAGYGITAKDYGYDDYEGIDVKGKIVIVLRYEPPPKDSNSPFRKYPAYSIHATLRRKASNARDHGASGMILVDLQDADGKSDLIPSSNSMWHGDGIVAAQARPREVEKWLESHGISLRGLRDKINRSGKPASLSVPGAQVALQVTLEEVRRRADNVVAILPGADPQLAEQNVVIGAHYDHIGFGHFGARDSGNRGRIHPGADDNASGVAVLLDLAQQLSQSGARPLRSILFAAFSAEELGLHGSRHYVDNPPVPLPSIRIMLNLDMVGRLRDDRITVFGTRSADELSPIVKSAAGKLGLAVSEADGIGRSDHTSFYSKKIPALHFFTGLHPDYHRPSDTWDKLNVEGMAKVSDLVVAVTRQIAEIQGPLNFASRPALANAKSRMEGPVSSAYLGSIPDYSGESDGVRLAGVTAGSPAAIAGLREGDVIVQLAETTIRTLEDLMLALGSKKPGDEVDIVVLRGQHSVSLKAVLSARG